MYLTLRDIKTYGNEWLLLYQKQVHEDPHVRLHLHAPKFEPAINIDHLTQYVY